MVSAEFSYRVVFVRSARKELESLDNAIARRILRRIEEFPLNPRPPGCKKLAGQNRLWRIRMGDYRVVYTIDDREHLIDIRVIRHRSKAYDDLD
jgi:mRNA interferase RelE/StbE